MIIRIYGMQLQIQLVQIFPLHSVIITKACLTEVVGENNLTNGDVFWPTRVAVSGAEKSPSPEDIMEVLGKEEGLTRIKIAIDKL